MSYYGKIEEYLDKKRDVLTNYTGSQLRTILKRGTAKHPPEFKRVGIDNEDIRQWLKHYYGD